MTESEIRHAVVRKLEATRSGASAAFIFEMFLDGFSRRADLVMANGKLCAFEIKSGLDSLVRLEGQLSTYQRFFEQVTVVCAEKHLSGVRSRTSENVGIWSVSKDGHITISRAAKTQAVLSKTNWLSFLPVDELRKFLRESGHNVRGTRDELVAAAGNTSLQRIRAYVLAFLKRRVIRIGEREARRAAGKKATPTSSQHIAEIERVQAYLRQQQSSTRQLLAIPRRIT